MNKLSIYNQVWHDLWNGMERYLFAAMDEQMNPEQHPYWRDDPYYIHTVVRDFVWGELDDEL